MTPKQLMAHLKKEGIETAEAMAEKLLDSMTAEEILAMLHPPQSEEMDLECLCAILSKEAKPPAAHFQPVMPFKLDGKFYSPEQVAEFPKTALHFFSESRAMTEGYMLAYTTRAELKKALAQKGLLSDKPSKKAMKSLSREDRHRFYEHVGFLGQRLSLGYGCFSDLTRVRMFPRGNWNDKISSIWTARNRGVIVFQHVNYEGDSWVIDANCAFITLGQWNDRISSVCSQLGTYEV